MAKAPVVKLVSTKVAFSNPTLPNQSHTYAVTTVGEFENDTFVVNAADAASAKQLGINEHERRCGQAPVTVTVVQTK